MADLLIVVPANGALPKAQDTFRRGIRLTELLKSQTPTAVVERDFACVASYARRNGSGKPIVSDPKTGNWLVAVGTWFHDDGYASGQEERLLARLRDIGAEGLAREVEGFFLIATGDAATREVTVITDVPGTLHAYTRSVDGGVAICVSSLVLAALGEVTLDTTACQEYLQTAAMYEDRTFFNEVRKLDAARCHRFRDGALVARPRYWNVTDLAPDSLDGQASVDALREAVLAGARKIGRAFGRPVVDLTGGYDSRVGVAAFLAGAVQFRTAVAGEPEHPDVVVSQALADRVGLEHRYFRPPPVQTLAQLDAALPFTDGEYDLVDFARIHAVQSDLAAGHDISINSYSGEIGRGYGWEVLMPHTGERRPLDTANVAVKRFVNPGFDASIVPANRRLDAATHFRDVMARVDEGLDGLPNTMQYDYCMTMMRCQRWYGRIASSTNQIWPCMSFFLLRSIIKPMLEANTRSRTNSLLFRRLLVELAPRLADYPLANGYPPLPVTWKTLHRFWPLVPLYGGKVVDRLRRRVGWHHAQNVDPHATPRMRLWRDPGVAELLDPARMVSLELLDRRGLEAFVSRSKMPDFDHAGQWSLVLSLEITLQRLRSLRTQMLGPSIGPAGARAGTVLAD